MKSPDILINHDTKILQEILHMAMGKNGQGVSINLFSVNQLNINLDSRKLNSPEQRLTLASSGLATSAGAAVMATARARRGKYEPRMGFPSHSI